MPEGFVPKIGDSYDRIRIQNDKVSRDAQYFKDAVSRTTDSILSCCLIETSSSILIWSRVEYIIIDLVKHLIANGISFEYDFAEFSTRHAMYIEDYDYASV